MSKVPTVAVPAFHVNLIMGEQPVKIPVNLADLPMRLGEYNRVSKQVTLNPGVHICVEQLSYTIAHEVFHWLVDNCDAPSFKDLRRKGMQFRIVVATIFGLVLCSLIYFFALILHDPWGVPMWILLMAAITVTIIQKPLLPDLAYRLDPEEIAANKFAYVKGLHYRDEARLAFQIWSILR